MSELQLELNELLELKGMIGSDVFQKFFFTPIKKELDNLKSAYDCQTLNELNRLKGRKDGLELFFNVIERIDTDIANKKYEIDNSPKE